MQRARLILVIAIPFIPFVQAKRLELLGPWWRLAGGVFGGEGSERLALLGCLELRFGYCELHPERMGRG
jgi:hypothetical protein